MQITNDVVLSMLAALVTGGVAAFAWRRRGRPGGLPVAAFNGAACVWTAGNALQAASTTLAGKLLWVDVQYLGIIVVPIAWFALACEYTGREEWANPRTLAALAVPLVAAAVLAWTNPYHHLVHASSEVVTVGGNASLRRTFGPAFWASWIYSNLVSGLGTVVFFHGLVRSRRLYRRQTLAVVAGTTVPWTATWLFFTGRLTVEPEAFFAVSGVAFAYAIAEYDFLGAAPVGRTTVFEKMDDPVVVLDDEERIADANPAAGALFGWERTDAMVGRPVAEVCEECAALVDCHDEDSDATVVVENPDGERRHFDVQSSSLSNDSTAGTALLLRDVTRRRRNERRLERQNEQLEEVGHTIAHDLRNPLNVAQGNAELAREADDPDAVAERLAAVESAHDRMEAIIDEVLAVATGDEPASRDRLDLRAVAEGAWRNVDTGGAELAFDGADVAVVADEGRLTSAFENLFRNAVEHGSTSPRSQAHENPVEHGESGVTVTVGSLDDGAGFYVADDGPGIPEDDRERVFERGFTTSAGGTGVGLAVVSDVADRHGWTVSATENEAGGARFEVRGVETPAAPRS
ncbi:MULTISPECIES: histidine kinase N-terminal 7TM domain-containing protein [Halorussus]|uniref:histidine kinase N-terminal 7TM domain-containing protein n=1 Tax=Halorussus TaxID=1070314 RepID=UPI000E2156E4|nr:MULTISPECIES: histidine kinase N-terminal 7TM domain-containing protein [Halorussus]NHN60583.1 PAS domain-containing protein [Halorussus sp. JP-T4]